MLLELTNQPIPLLKATTKDAKKPCGTEKQTNYGVLPSYKHKQKLGPTHRWSTSLRLENEINFDQELMLAAVFSISNIHDQGPTVYNSAMQEIELTPAFQFFVDKDIKAGALISPYQLAKLFLGRDERSQKDIKKVERILRETSNIPITVENKQVGKNKKGETIETIGVGRIFPYHTVKVSMENKTNKNKRSVWYIQLDKNIVELSRSQYAPLPIKFFQEFRGVAKAHNISPAAVLKLQTIISSDYRNFSPKSSKKRRLNRTPGSDLKGLREMLVPVRQNRSAPTAINYIKQCFEAMKDLGVVTSWSYNESPKPLFSWTRPDYSKLAIETE